MTQAEATHTDMHRGHPWPHRPVPIPGTNLGAIRSALAEALAPLASPSRARAAALRAAGVPGLTRLVPDLARREALSHCEILNALRRSLAVLDGFAGDVAGPSPVLGPHDAAPVRLSDVDGFLDRAFRDVRSRIRDGAADTHRGVAAIADRICALMHSDKRPAPGAVALALGIEPTRATHLDNFVAASGRDLPSGTVSFALDTLETMAFRLGGNASRPDLPPAWLAGRGLAVSPVHQASTRMA